MARADATVMPPDQKTRAVRTKTLETLDADVERIKTPVMYLVSVILATIVVVMLPLIYLAIVAGAAWGVYWYARYGGDFAVHVGSISYLVTRFGPVVVGAILFFFLLKPLLARPPAVVKPYTLTRDRNPFLFEFITHLSDRLDAPMPYRIDADLQVNASASFATGLSSLLTGRLALTIGMPLVSSMRLRELTVVLAHEFGHCSQGAGMRFYYLSAMVNQWFARVVFERDSWDEWLELWSESDSLIIEVILGIAQLLVWLSRKTLFLLMMIGSAIRSLMSREMEFDADQSAVRICGVRSFVQAMETLPLIEAAAHWADAANGQAHRHGRLADDYPYLVYQGLGKLDDETRRQILDQSSAETVTMYATHPPMRERIARAEMIGLDGIFNVDAPAAILFDDFAGLCSEITALDYKMALGSGFQKIEIVTAADVQSEIETIEERALERNRFFLRGSPGPVTLDLEPLNPGAPAEPQVAIDELNKIRLEMPSLVATWESFGEQVSIFVRATAVKKLLDHKLAVLDGDYANATPSEADMAARKAFESLESRERWAPYGQAMKRRIGLTLDLLCHPTVADRITDANMILAQATDAVSLMARLKDASEQAFKVSCQLSIIQVLLQQVDGQPADDVEPLMYLETHTLRKSLIAMRKIVRDVPWPIDDVEMLFTDHFAPNIPEDSLDLYANFQVASEAMEQWQHLIDRLTTAIAKAGLAAEEAMGLSPLEDAPGLHPLGS